MTTTLPNMPMITLTVDGRPIRTADGTTILEAARSAGIEVPTLCWYPRLPVVGSCRICLVDVAGSPKLAAACATAAQDGMVVETESPAAVANRKSVLGLLLERYPADHLLAGGNHPNEFEQLVRRYGVAVRPAREHELALRTGDERPGDPMIRHDMSTCILCTRCVRACADIQVVGVLDVAQRGATAQIVVGGDGDPDHAACTWCGECVRVCPTGAIHEVLPAERFTSLQIAEPDRVVRSVCPYCGVGCQVDLHVADEKVVRVTSPWIEEDTPNIGSTCVKGRFGYDFPQHRDRLTTPLIRRGWVKRAGRWVWEGPAEGERRRGPWLSIEAEGERDKPRPPARSVGKSLGELSRTPRGADDVRDRVATPASWYEPFREATWDEAMELAAQELVRLHAERGPEALAVFCSAKCTNEENYVLQRIFRGRFGTNNVDHCTRLCHSSSVAAMQRALSTSAASGSMREVEDEADVIFVAGANVTEAHPVFGAALKRAQRRGATLIVAEPRGIELARRADIHLQLMPGTDVVLFNAMLNHVIAQGLHDRAFIAARTHGFEEVAAAVAPYTLERAEAITGVPAADIARAAELYARGPRTSTLWAMGLTQHSTGTDIVASLLNLILGTGMIGRWGAAMIPIRGQNNVQGASDVGGIPMSYTDYQPVSDPAVRHRFAEAWGVGDDALSLKPGLKVTEIVGADSPVAGMYIFGENPVISDPNVAHAEHWFLGLEFLAVQDLFLTDTARFADVVLPAAGWLEKEGTMTNSERRISHLASVVAPPGEALPDGEILLRFACKMGWHKHFDYQGMADVYREHAALTQGTSIDISGLDYGRLQREGSVQWPVPHAEHPGAPRLFTDGRFFRPNQRDKLHAVPDDNTSTPPSEDFPLVLTTGRIRDQWHTMTRTGKVAKLRSHDPTSTSSNVLRNS